MPDLKNVQLRPSTAPTERKDRGQRTGRAPIVLPDDQLEACLVAQMSYAEIAKKYECTTRTVARRVRDARKRHGKGWPAAVTAAKVVAARPASLPPVDLARRRTAAELTIAADATLYHLLEHGTPDQQLRAATAIRNLPPAELPVDAKVDHGALLERVRHATKSAKGLRVVDGDGE